MDPWSCLLKIAIAGAIGGIVNAAISDEGVPLPYWKKGIWCPGFLGNAFIGAVAASVSWMLYGSGSGVDLAADSPRQVLSLTFAALAGATLVGIGGARWLTNEVDKRFLQEAASEAGEKKIPHEDCTKLRRVSPRKALDIVDSYPDIESSSSQRG
jgi:hypothetical protein